MRPKGGGEDSCRTSSRRSGMHELPRRLSVIAAGQRNLVTRPQLAAIGWTDRRTERALADGWLQRLHPGVFVVGAAPPDWHQRLLAAVRAAGDGAEASHRSALHLHGLLAGTPSIVEVSAPHNGNPRPMGTVLHRTRRVEPIAIAGGIECSSVERALLETSALAPQVVIEKAFSAAWRRGLTSPEKCDRYLEHHGGKGRRGVTRFRAVVELYLGTGRAPGSDGEVAFLRCLRNAGIEEPTRQFAVVLPDGSKIVVDFAWIERRKLIEFVGLEVHADSRAHAADTLREDDLVTTTGFQLRRFAPETLRTNPEEVARRVLRFLGA